MSSEPIMHATLPLPSPPRHIIQRLSGPTKKQRCDPGTEEKLEAAAKRRQQMQRNKVTRARSTSADEGSRVLKVCEPCHSTLQSTDLYPKVVTQNLQRITQQHEIQKKSDLAQRRREASIARKADTARQHMKKHKEKKSTIHLKEMESQSLMREALVSQANEAAERRANIESQRIARAHQRILHVETTRQSVKAARQLQSWWRCRHIAAQRASILQAYSSQFIHVATAIKQASDTDCGAAMAVLHSKLVINDVRGILNVTAEAGVGATIGTESAPALAKSPRTFLAAVLVAHHPSLVPIALQTHIRVCDHPSEHIKTKLM